MEQTASTQQIVVAGLASGLAFLAEQALDQAIWPDGYSDMKMLGMIVTRHPRRYWWVAVPWHLLNSIGFAWLYARVVGPRLPGPGPVRGVTMALLENNVLWFTGIPVVNRIHPAVRAGQMRPLTLGGVDWLIGNLRHVALGLVLGALCPVDRKP